MPRRTHPQFAAGEDRVYNISPNPSCTIRTNKAPQANPKAALVKDDDERLPIHWAVAYNRLPIVELLVASKNFDPDVEVRFHPTNTSSYLELSSLT